MSDARIVTRVSWLLAWQLGAMIVLIFVGAVVQGLPPWSLGIRDLGGLGLLVMAYLLSTVQPSVCFMLQHPGSRWPAALLTAMVFAATWAVSPVLLNGWMPVWPFLAGQKPSWLLEWPISANLFLIFAVLAVLMNAILAGSTSSRKPLAFLSAGAALLVVINSLPGVRGPWLYHALDQPQTYEANASHHRLRISYFRDRIPPPLASGGALAVFEERLLLMTGDGEFYALSLSDDSKRLDARRLSQRVPLNYQAFIEANPNLSGFLRRVFRASDLLLTDLPEIGGLRLLASHHYFHEQDACYSVRVSSLKATWKELLSGAPSAQWQTLFEAKPCLPLFPEGKLRFTGHQTGGSLLEPEPGKVLLALGDGGFDGVQSPRVTSQDPDSAFGKVVEIELATGQVRFRTSGHRSPAGLHKDARGRIWLTEHGPRGGDELNLIREGANYGWPRQTLGSQYGMLTWPAQDTASSEGLRLPAFAWTPSIGISALTDLGSREFGRWSGDLIVSSLADRALYRVHLKGDTPILTERIPVYERVRDLVQDHRGRIVFWSERPVIGVIDTLP